MSGQITVETTQNVDLQFQLAPLGERILATLIDGFIRVALIIVAVFVFGALMDSPNTSKSSIVVMLIVFAIPVVGYHLWFEIFNNGQSPGKKAFDLRVVSLKGTSVSIGAYILRWLFRLVDFQIFSGLVALIAVASSRKGQRIGDMVAGTTVIKESRQVRFRQLAYDESPREYIPTYPNARDLRPAHIELIKELLNNFDLESGDVLVARLADKTAKMLDVHSDEHPRKFLRTVLQDYYGSQ